MNVNVCRSALEAKPDAIVGRTLRWWDAARRDLPWRTKPGARPDPYRVWLSEVLLQQTTAQAAAPYFLKFVEAWPTVEDLACASTEAVIGAFAGLGYYSRARNLHACAKAVAARGGQFPDQEADLRRLPGVGDYTAAAIAAIAFGRRAAPVDGNIRRVLARLLALDLPPAELEAQIRAAALELAPARRAGDFSQALMDIGATICRPKNPACDACPLRDDCAARRFGVPGAFPSPPAAKAKPRRIGTVFFAHRADGAFLARRRPPHGLLASTVELPGSAWTSAGPGAAWRLDAPASARWQRAPGGIEQAFTHFVLSLTVFAAPFDGAAPEGLFWLAADAVGRAGLSSVMRKSVAHAAKAVRSRPPS